MSSPSSPPRPRQRKIGSRSCDGCKIRKVKCSETPPCSRCLAIGIDCTFHKNQKTRGPRTLRARTLQQIREAAQQEPQQNEPNPPSSAATAAQQNAPDVPETTPQHHSTATSTPEVTIDSLVLRLCIYRIRLFPVWPIVAVEGVIAALHRDSHDVETLALAVAVGAATMAQLKLDRFQDAGLQDTLTATSLEAACQRIRRGIDNLNGLANLNTLRTSFFLHVYHENLEPGGAKSLLYLREAITLAQIMGLHRPSSYLSLDPAEDRLRRRILWLLFVTERGVAMLHKLPVVLRSAENLPPLSNASSAEDEAHILPAFKKLVNLFWIFDQSRAFDILQDAADNNGIGAAGSASLNPEILNALQRRLLQDAPLVMESGSNDIQNADIWVTRQWMQVLLWRATLGHWGARHKVPGPVQIAQEFLDAISQLPSAALEAHGPAIEFKIYEIASAVADSLSTDLDLPMRASANVQPSNILIKLQGILATSRGGNNNLLGLLGARIAQIEVSPHSGTSLGVGLPQGEQRVEEIISDEDPQDWGMDSSVGDLEPASPDRPRSRHPSLSPWLSLVTAAEFEHQSVLCYSGSGETNSTPQSPTEGGGGNTRNSTSWYTQPFDPYAPTDASSLSVPPPAGDALTDVLANQNWFMGPRI
ncbi:hypothetical protein B0H63DRAFT_524491 [Podospora didyma]|uniref:Zn(2)-C6 fungal-type domain-containing protein n=1 Tax=Podospora didyma TaxID=330526 RepID=A0AAE0NHX6_9PEZI|nr:hypothetical protein B0H63DRAFT_524491 [Podospora didyma]